jgi:LacI family transcriptional regulator
VATASKVLNHSAGSTMRVSEETSRRVLETACRLNYHTNLQASSLRCGSSRLVGVLLDSASWEGLARLLVEVEHQAALHDYQLMVSGEHDSISRFIAGYQRLRQYGAEGIICVSHDYQFCGNELYDFLQQESEHVVLVGRPRCGDFWYVDIDYAASVRIPFEFFVSSGRRRIVQLCFAGEYVCLQEIRKEFSHLSEAACGCEGIETRIVQVEGSIDRRETASRVEAIIDSELLQWGCDAVITQSDALAGMVIHGLLRRGVKVPEGVAVIGHGNDSFDEMMTPNIATVDDGLAAQGRAAFDLIRRQIEMRHGGDNSEKTIVVKPDFHCRQSAG